jgi:hypothetical protein
LDVNFTSQGKTIQAPLGFNIGKDRPHYCKELRIYFAPLVSVDWIFPKKIDTIKRTVSGSVFHIQLGKDTQLLSAFSADCRRPQYIQKSNAMYPYDLHIVDGKPTRFS